THLLLVDVRPFGITGKVAEAGLEEAGITTNKNTIPFDPEKPFVTSGIRIGTPALTTRGMKEGEMKTVGKLIARVLKDVEDEKTVEDVLGAVTELCTQFPIYADMKSVYAEEAVKHGFG
ncbi:MAG: serine hydroxymethyltransferase, partial [bacterium]|nr:serine hydroxymethyltransferase [bacterium]